MTRFAGLAALCLGLAFTPVAAPVGIAQEDALRSALDSIVDDSAKLEATLALRFKSLPSTHLRLIAEHTQALLQEDGFADLVVGVATPMIGNSSDAIFDRGAEVGIDLQTRGLARLPTERQEEFLRYSADMYRWLGEADVEACKNITAAPVMPPASEMQRLEYEYLATVSVEQMTAVLQLYRDAILAEVRKVPPQVTLTAGQRDAAMFAYSNRVMSRLQSRADFEALKAAALDFIGAPARDVCNFSLVSMEAVFDLNGDERIWLFQTFVETLDDPL